MNNNLPQGLSVAGYVGDSSWNYYHATPATTSNMIIQVNASFGDCDLYVKSGQNPTIYSYDYRDVGIDKLFTLYVPNPGTQTWYLGIFGYSACQYSIQYTVSNGCPGTPTPCSGNGQCYNGVCSCNPGFGGDDCSVSSVTDLNSGYSRTGTIATSSSLWKYYSFVVSGTSYISFDLSETNTVGYLYLYVLEGRTPDNANYDYADISTDSKYHRIHLEFFSPINATYFVGVYANSYAIGNMNIDFSISAWSTPF